MRVPVPVMAAVTATAVQATLAAMAVAEMAVAVATERSVQCYLLRSIVTLLAQGHRSR